MNYPIVTLFDYTNISWGNTSITKKSYIEHGYPAFSAAGQDGFLPHYEFDEVGIVLSAIGARCGKCFFANGKWTAIKNTITITLKDKEHLDLKFLFCIVDNEKFWPQRGGGQPFIALSDARKIKIPLPPLNDQKRIAHLLDKVEGLIAQRKQHLQQLDDLLKSVFLEMFGDPVRNEKGWDIIYWDDLFVTRTGKLNANAMSEGGDYPFFTCAKEIFQIDSFAFDCEALILAGNNATGDYDVKHYKGKFNAYQRTYILELKADTDEYPFFRHHLEMKLRHLKDGSKGANTRYLTKQFLGTIAFIQPSEEFQKKFSKIAKKIESIKFCYQQSLIDLEALYGALSQKAFKGELDLSRVPLV